MTQTTVVNAREMSTTLYNALVQCRLELEEASKLFKGFGYPGLAKIYAEAAKRVDDAVYQWSHEDR